jgi:hypothetical protein
MDTHASAIVPAGEDIYDYYIKNNLYSDFRTYNETHPWPAEEIEKYMTAKTVDFFANYSEKGYLISHIDNKDIMRNEPVIFIAGCTNLPELVMYLIMSVKCDITAINDYGSTLLIKLTDMKYSNIIIILLSIYIIKLTPLIRIQNKFGATALIWACRNNMTKVALALIATGESNPSAQINDSKTTALIYACEYKMIEVALALIATGESTPGAQSDDNKTTALFWACYNKMTEVALALIATGESNPSAQCSKGCTSLIHACYNKMTDVALAILATGNCNSLAINKSGHDALYYAKTPELTSISKKICMAIY